MAQYSAIAENVQNMDAITHLRTKYKKLRFLNLHGNCIRVISNIDNCYYLEELDLSSNKISIISGLEGCESLLKLNLACNQIRLASGLDFLYKLRILNLSYNKLSSVKSLSHFSERRFQLEHLLLHGNKLSSVPGTIGGIKKILSLKHLTLHSNPMCSKANYRKVFGDCMPQLETIDDFPRADDSFSDTVTTESSVSTQPIATPYIDRAVQGFKHQEESEGSYSEDTSARAEQIVESPNVKKVEQGADYTNLIKQVLTILRDSDQQEEVPTKLDKGHSNQPPSPPDHVTSPPDHVTQTHEPVLDTDLESLKSTNKLLLVELEAERERRWKSEKHIATLSDKLVKNDHAIKEYEQLNKSSEAGINGIREMLLKEQSQKMKLASILETFKEKHKEVVAVLSQKTSLVKEHEQELASLRSTIEGLKRGVSETSKQHKQALQQARQEAQVQRKQCELLRHEVNDQQVQVKGLQELVVTREQEHVKEKDNLVPLHGEVFNVRVRELVENEKEKHQLLNKNLIASSKGHQQRYQDLEKEFRIALYLENKRYEELHAAYTKISEQLTTYRTELGRYKSDDVKKVSLIDKLRRSVAEQSHAIDQIRLARKEGEGKSGGRIAALERELEETTKSVIELTSFQKENQSLKDEISGQVSVIEGLRAERGLWSKELAEQGAQLSVDRGRLESEISRLTNQNAEHSHVIQKITDTAKIKEHQLVDAMDTITKLKESLTNTHTAHKEELHQLQTELKSRFEEAENAEARVEAIREALHSSQEEKEEVAEKYEQQIQECEALRRKYRDLKSQWEERIAAFEKVERAAQGMSKVHEEQINKIKETLEAERLRVKSLENEIQLINDKRIEENRAKDSEQEARLAGLSEAHLTKEEEYKTRISGLEQEMRVIIHQSQQLKKDNEDKLTKLAGALSEFTSFLQPKS